LTFPLHVIQLGCREQVAIRSEQRDCGTVQSVVGDDELSGCVAAHSVDRSGSASSHRIGITTGMLGGDSNGAISPADDGVWMVEGIGAAEVDDKSCVLGTGREGHTGANLNAECFVGFGVRNARRRRCIGTPAPPNVDGARSGSRTTRVCCGTNTYWIRSRADINLEFLISVLTDRETA
jgi:hypothetical protein